MKIVEANPYDPEAVQLMNELSDCLKEITGRSGKASFDPEDVCVPKALFLIAYTDDGEAVGCGAIRPMEDNNIAEVKRMYARLKSYGVGTQILQYLEKKAKEYGYSTLQLETGLINQHAVNFYEKQGYHRIKNYGKYIDMPKSVCFEKKL